MSFLGVIYEKKSVFSFSMDAVRTYIWKEIVVHGPADVNYANLANIPRLVILPFYETCIT